MSMSDHEYALLGGVNRATIGRYLGAISASVSAAAVFVVLTFIDLANKLGLPASVPPSVLSLLGAGSVFALLYWIFDRFVWRWSPVGKLLKVPNLSGDWTCDGRSLTHAADSGEPWTGRITIIQSWDKLRIRLRTEKSGSNSLTAALAFDSADGYRLLYHYRNDPAIDQADLAAHHGFAEIVFDRDLQHATGEYFNGRGRFTFGTIDLTRV